MTYEQAVEKAKANAGNMGDTFGQYEAALQLVGKTLVGVAGQNPITFEVLEIVNGNFIMKINGSDYNISPTAWTLKMVGTKVKVAK